MLSQIYVRNYALIEELKLDFHSGFTAITGETGAGKSILLGAISLLLGERADSKQLYDANKKCIVEGSFLIKGYDLRGFFEEAELDYFEDCIIRREVNPDGRSRAFINDTPVNLSVLRSLAEDLVDVHSQNDNLSLNDSNYQLTLLDSFAGLAEERKQFTGDFRIWKSLVKDLEEREARIAEARRNRDYLQFQLEELQAVSLDRAAENDWEERLQLMEHSEEIKQVLTALSEELYESGIADRLSVLVDQTKSLKGVNDQLDELIQRLEESQIELQDIGRESSSLSEDIDFDPAEFSDLKDKVDQLNSLLFKHNAQSANELVQKREEIDATLNENEAFEEDLEALRSEIDAKRSALQERALVIRKHRAEATHSLRNRVLQELAKLKMENSDIQFELSELDELNESGLDKLNILFDANRSGQVNSLSKVASGGERSRLLLALRRVLAEVHTLPSIIFDEIDTGVSGEVALKVGQLISEMSRDCQIMSITHLPQIAGKANQHLRVRKEEQGGRIMTIVEPLNKDERILEIAQMLSGKDPSQAALGNARELLSN